jgi:hypothetical protein
MQTRKAGELSSFSDRIWPAPLAGGGRPASSLKGYRGSFLKVKQHSLEGRENPVHSVTATNHHLHLVPMLKVHGGVSTVHHVPDA